MSTDWGIGCRDCAEMAERVAHWSESRSDFFTGEWNNCREVENLSKLCEASDEIIALADKVGKLCQLWWGDWHETVCYGLVEFMRAHPGHRLAPMDKYGRFHDQCWKDVACGECQTRHKCKLMRDHDGDCVRNR